MQERGADLEKFKISNELFEKDIEDNASDNIINSIVLGYIQFVISV